MTEEGKEKKVNIDFEPFKQINTSLYLCDNKFHTEALSELLESENKYGFIVMDGNGSLFGTLSGNTREASSPLLCFYQTLSTLPDPAQIYRRPAKEARPRRAVCAAFRAPANGKAPQLCAQGCGNGRAVLHYHRQGTDD